MSFIAIYFRLFLFNLIPQHLCLIQHSLHELYNLSVQTLFIKLKVAVLSLGTKQQFIYFP